MTGYVDSHPTARKRHRCTLCHRTIQPGEMYWRQVAFDAGAHTFKTCEHCERTVVTYCRSVGDDQWTEEDVMDWLRDDHPGPYATMLAGWRFPDGELAPPPFSARCYQCGCRIPWLHLWCEPCDLARIARLNTQFAEIRQALGVVTT